MYGWTSTVGVAEYLDSVEVAESSDTVGLAVSSGVAVEVSSEVPSLWLVAAPSIPVLPTYRIFPFSNGFWPQNTTPENSVSFNGINYLPLNVRRVFFLL